MTLAAQKWQAPASAAAMPYTGLWLHTLHFAVDRVVSSVWASEHKSSAWPRDRGPGKARGDLHCLWNWREWDNCWESCRVSKEAQWT